MKDFYKKNIIGFISLLCFISFNYLFAQVKGEEPPLFGPDTTFIFDSPRPLIMEPKLSTMDYAYGMELFFSESGFALGGFYQHVFAKDFFMFANLCISGARNTDEFEYWNYQEQRYLVTNKINRLFRIPFTLGVQRFVLADLLVHTLRPYFIVGIGPTFILSTPYAREEQTNDGLKTKYYEFFNSFAYTECYVRFGGFVGIGANFGSVENTLMGFSIKYYYIPFGGKGLESVKELPITNFGGLFLSLSVGVKY